MIGAIIACDSAEAARRGMLLSERRLAAGFGRPFPFPEPHSLPDPDPLANEGRGDRPDTAPAWPRQRLEGGEEPPVADPASSGPRA